MYIGIDWFSTKHSEYKNGVKTNDPFTKNNFKTGQFKKANSTLTNTLKIIQNKKLPKITLLTLQNLADHGAADDYYYLTTGAAHTGDSTYTAGKLMIKFYGHPQV